MSTYSIYKSFTVNGFEFSSKYELEDKIQETEHVIRSIEDRIKMWAISDPNTVIPEKDEYGEPITDKVWYVQHAINDELDSLKDFYIDLSKLYLMEYNWDDQEYPEDRDKKWEKEKQEKLKKQQEEQNSEKLSTDVNKPVSNSVDNSNNYSPMDKVHDLKPGEFSGFTM